MFKSKVKMASASHMVLPVSAMLASTHSKKAWSNMQRLETKANQSKKSSSVSRPK